MLILRFNFAAFVILIFVFAPINNLVFLQISNIVISLCFLFLYPKIDKNLLYLFLAFSIFTLLINFLAANFSFVMFKPIISFFNIVCFSGYINYRKMHHVGNLKAFLFVISGSSLLLFLGPFNGLEYLYRGDSYDLYHSSRLTAPFLFAGDLANAALFIAIALFSHKKRNWMAIIVLILTQSKLGYLAFLSVIDKILLKPHIIYFFVFSFLAAYFFNLGQYFYHIFSFLGNFFEYLTESKRAREYIWVAINFDEIFFNGTNMFTADSFTSDAESSIISYIVKVGFLSSLFYWIAISSYLLRNRLGLFLFLSLFFSVFAAPLDRPKLAPFLLFMAPLLVVNNYRNSNAT